MIAQEQSPLAVVGDRRRLRHDVGDRQAIFLAQRHVNARHQRESGTPCGTRRHRRSRGAHRPATGWLRPESGGWRSRHRWRRGCVLITAWVSGRFSQEVPSRSHQVRNGVHAQRVHAHVEPEAHRLQHFFDHQRVIEVQVGLMRKEAMPVVGLGRLVPGPVGFLRVGEDDARVFVESGRCRTRRTCRAAGEPGGARRAALNQGC